MQKIKLISKNNFSRIPQNPGVYFLYAKNKKPVYIGKASSLRERIKSHFKNPSFLLQKETANIKRIDYIETRSEIEAFLLEPQMIKKYQPKLNIRLRDDKNYFYVGITKEKFPKIFITHQPKSVSSISYLVSGILQKKIQNTKYKILNTKFIGPFTDGKTIKQTLGLLRKVFPFYAKKHGLLPCFYCHLGLCPGPPPKDLGESRSQSERKSFIKEYQKNMKKLTEVLRGKRKSVVKTLKREMLAASQAREFEKAARIRNQIWAIENIFEHQNFLTPILVNFPSGRMESLPNRMKEWFRLDTIPKRIEAYDVSNIQGASATGSMIVFSNGKPDKSQYRKFRIKTKKAADDIAMLKEVIFRRFKHPEWSYPDLILVDGGIAQLNAAKLTIKQFNHLIIRIISLAKRENKLYFEGEKNSIPLKDLPAEISNLILHLRDEAHRFAIQYHRKLHGKLFSNH